MAIKTQRNVSYTLKDDAGGPGALIQETPEGVLLVIQDGNSESGEQTSIRIPSTLIDAIGHVLGNLFQDH